MVSSPGSVVLITGCSSGIGAASARSLHRHGATVYATARRPESLVPLADEGIATLQLDVTDEASMTAAVSDVVEREGRVDVLVNNAGYGLYGPVEQLPMDEIRRQFDTNFFGLVRMTQLVLPHMRAAGRGRILNISSMGGRTTLPGGAFYHASKHAVESLSDALRVEVGPFSIDVVLIEPGPVKTAWNDVAQESVSSAPEHADEEDDPYLGFKQAVAGGFDAVVEGPFSRLASDADDIAKVIAKAVTTSRPRTRYLINPVAKSTVAAKALLPDRVHDLLLRRQFGLP